MVGRHVAKKEMVGRLPAVSRFNAYQAKWICMIIVRVLGKDVNFMKWIRMIVSKVNVVSFRAGALRNEGTART